MEPATGGGTRIGWLFSTSCEAVRHSCASVEPTFCTDASLRLNRILAMQEAQTTEMHTHTHTSHNT